ncbi:MAG: hypothetical protein KKD18_00980, partial [Nanoarchaeota archaeon]|nr:hypothetical protein [Nanoarchaeota archaeon]
MRRRPLLELLREREERFFVSTQLIEQGYSHSSVLWRNGFGEYLVNACLLRETFEKAQRRFPNHEDVLRISN